MPKIYRFLPVLSLALALGLTACGGKNENDKKSGDKQEQPHADGPHDESAHSDKPADADDAKKDDKAKAETVPLLEQVKKSDAKATIAYNASGKVEDATLSIADLEAFDTEAKFGGSYLGPFSSSIRKVIIKTNGNILYFDISYDKSVISDDGMVDLVPASLNAKGKASDKGQISLDSPLKLSDPVRTFTKAQFVSWKGGQGILLQGTESGNTAYLLLRKE